MPNFEIRYDFRCPPGICPVGPADLYEAALEQCEWAESLGFSRVTISEHHGADDGYLPSLVAMGSAIAARTSQMRIRLGAIIVSLHDPLRLAEDLAVLDNISRGRLEVVIANGYVPSEFAMFDVKLSDRVKLVTEAVEAIKSAWTGEPFDYRGRTVRVTPKPCQEPRPPIVLGGASEGAARRAARIADDFMPTMPKFWDFYRDELQKQGKPDPGPMMQGANMYLHVTEDVGRTWEQIAPHALHEMNSYGQWAAEAESATGYQPVDDIEMLKGIGMHKILTPAETVELVNSTPDDGAVLFHPLMGGLDPEIAWENLRLFESEVLPHVR